MIPAPQPAREAERLAALRQYAILDTPRDPACDELVRLAAELCAVPIALLGFVDEHRLWFKSRLGLEVTEVPRDGSLCAHTIVQDGIFVVEDVSADARFRDSPLVTGPSRIRFYAGVPLANRDGLALGALCVLDRKPRSLTPIQADALAILGRQVMTHLELRRHLGELARQVEEHRRIEEQLRTSEVFYENLVEALPQHILRKDRAGRFTFANRKFCDLLSQPLEAVLGRTDHDFFPRELADKYQRDDLRVMSTAQALDTIEPHVTPRGDKRYVHVLKTPLYDALGRVVGIQGIFWDVTDRKRVEEDLAYERDLLRALLQTTPDRIFFKDVDSRFLRCSASMVKRLGLTDPKQVEGKTDFDFFPREWAQEYYADEQKVILTQQPLINKVVCRATADGQEVWSSVTKVPILNQSGVVTGLVGISRDVTALKQAEAALKHARDNALELARIKSQFLANMSHEIRTPMHAITGMASLLAGTPLTTEQRDYLETLRQSADSLLGLINAILDHSKIESGKLVLEHLDFHLRDTVETAVMMLAERAQQKGLELACGLDHGLPLFLRGDAGRFVQVLMNLLSNAVKFTERGEVVVRVLKQSETHDRVVVRVVVRDTGVGIPPEAMARIFEAFTQADGSTTRRFGGTGLGLTISRQLVEAMGGTIAAESVVGQGSTFTLTLPFEKQTVPAGNVSTLPLEKLSQRRVLVADDSATVCELLGGQLQAWGAISAAVPSVAEALRRLREAAAAAAPFDLALVDLTLADADGLELARQIRADAALASVRIVLLTPLGRRPDVEALARAGVAACLFKPLRHDRLFQGLLDVLEHQAHAGPSAPAALPTADASSGLATVAQAREVRLLLAEDNVVNQQVSLIQLRKLGFLADAVGNGAEVVAAVRRTPYDIILMDCQMPEMDGYEATRRVREVEKERGLAGRAPAYIVALTANALAGDRDRCLEAGMDDYLSKPLRLSHLRAALQRALARLAPTEPGRTETQAVPDAAPIPSSGSRASAEERCLDPTILAGLRSMRQPGQPDPFKPLGELFLRDARQRVQEMEAAVAAGNAARLAAAAHALKGSASNLGARRLSALCAALERQGKAGDLTDAASVLLNVTREFHAVEAALVTEMQT